MQGLTDMEISYMAMGCKMQTSENQEVEKEVLEGGAEGNAWSLIVSMIQSHLPLPMPLLEDVGVWSRPTRSPVIKWNRNLLYQKHCDSRWYFWLNICQACLSPDRQHGCVWEAFLSPWVYYEPNRNHYNQRARKFEKQYFYIFQGMYIFVASSWCASMQIIYD